MNNKNHSIIKWTARILAAAILLFGLPFYFGYGNPLPFVNPDYTLWDNTWLTVFPFMFIGLALGWKFEIIGGIFVTIPIFIGFIIGILTRQGFSIHMAVPFLVGVLYLTSGLLKNYKQREGNQ